MFDNIFISYATEDFQYAEKLYEFLSTAGYKPWMDKKNLLPGQNWDFFIQNALRKADFIILLLSSTSVNKRGYVQKKFTKALNYCEEKLDSDVFIIPIKIDNCEIPEKLSKFQWTHYNASDCFYKISESIRLQQQVLIKDHQKKLFIDNNTEIIEKSIIHEYGKNSPKQKFEANIQLFKNPQSESLQEINIKIENEALDTLIGARNNYFSILINSKEEDFSFINDSYEDIDISISLIRKGFVSYLSHLATYNTGAAHGLYGSIGKNFYLNPLRDFKLDELIEDFQCFWKILRDAVDKKLMEMAKWKFDLMQKKPSDFYYTVNGLEAEWENFKNYFFNERGIVFIYNPYEITPFSMGENHVEISYAEILELFPDEKKLIDFINSIK